MLGKAYANRKPVEERPESDFYRTPECLTELLFDLDTPLYNGNKDKWYEPMSGDGAIVDVLKRRDVDVAHDDIRTTGKDFLDFQGEVPYIITNPAFSIFTETVQKCKEDKFFRIHWGNMGVQIRCRQKWCMEGSLHS